MILPIHVVDAFTDRRFAGNPAAVVRFDAWPEDVVLQAIAAENNLAETAFLVPAGADWDLRWCTPTNEVPLCGHATLASAWVILECVEPARTEVRFRTRHSGTLTVRRAGRGFVMDFPLHPASPFVPPVDMAAILGIEPAEMLASARSYMAVLRDAAQVRALAPDIDAIARLDCHSLIVTAPGDDGYDCVSRFFTPRHGIPEDPVTGGAHCTIAPFWSERLGKPEIRAFQASARGGAMTCRPRGDRVELEGECVPYLTGTIQVDV